jgi:hypothetical protein
MGMDPAASDDAHRMPLCKCASAGVRERMRSRLRDSCIFAW